MSSCGDFTPNWILKSTPQNIAIIFFASEYYSKLKFDIEFSFEKLSDELQDVVRQYVWGEFSYIDSWKEIGELCFGSMRQGGTARAKICECLAEVRGYLI